MRTVLGVLCTLFLSTISAVQPAELYSGMVLNPDLDLIPQGPYEVGYRQFTTFDANAMSVPFDLPEQYNAFGFPQPPTQVNGTGRLTTYGNFFPVNKGDVIGRNGRDIWPRATLQSITHAQFRLVNLSAPFDNPPLDRSIKHPIVMNFNGFQDEVIEYFWPLMKLASYGADVTAVIAHGGDWTEPFFGHVKNAGLVGRVSDAVNGLEHVLNENNDPHSTRYHSLNPEQLICRGHSDGGETCYLLQFGGREQEIPPSPLYTGALNIVFDPADFFNNYIDMKNSDFKNMAIWTQNDEKTQELVRSLNGNVNPVVNAHMYVPRLIHQMLQLHDCQLSILSILTGALANSKGWMIQGQWYVDFCGVPSEWIAMTEPPVNLQEVMNLILWLDHQALISFGIIPGRSVPSTDLYLYDLFKTRNMYEVRDSAFPGLFLYFNGHQKCGNISYDNVTTALEIGHGTRFHGYAPSSDSTASDQYIDNAPSYDPKYGTGTYIVDCKGCSIWGTSFVNAKGRQAITFAEPSLSQLASNPACNCPLGRC